MGGFNADKFRNATYHHRTAIVDVPELVDYFDPGEKPELTVRGLTGEELATAREAMQLNAAVGQLAAGGGMSEQVKNAFMVLTGATGDRVPNEYALRIAMVRIGTGLEQDVVVRLGQNHCIAFGVIAQKIDQLTGMGRITEGELNASG